MRKIVFAAFAAAVLFCPAAFATGEQQTFLNPPISSRGIGIVNGSTTCGTTALLFATPGVGTMRILATGTFTSGNIRVQASMDGTNFTGDLTVYPRIGGAGATTIAAAGDFTLPVLGDMYICVYGSSFTGAATVQVGFAPVSSSVVVHNTSADPLFVTGSLSVSGTADVVSAGAPTTFNNNAICTGSLLLAGEQTATFELNAGTLAATLTPQCSNEVSGTTNFTNGVFKDASGTATNTLVVTNPNALTNLQVVCPGARRAQVCTTAFTSGSATGLANGVFFQGGASAGGGGGNVNVNQLNGTTTDTNSGAKSAGTLRVVLATDQPALTNKLLVTPDSVALPANQSVNESQINGVTPLMGNGVSGTGSQRVNIASDNTPFTVNAVGTKTNNNAAPGATNLGVLPCLATAATPTWTEGNLVNCSVDLSGNLRTSGGGGGGGTSSSFGATFPATGTAAGFKVVSSAPTLTAGNMDAPTLTTGGEQRTALTSSITLPVQGLGTANSPAGGVSTFQPPSGATVPMPIYTPGATGTPTGAIAANAADNSAVAATLNSACTTQTACTAAQSIQWSLAGSAGSTLTITATSTPSGIALVCDESWDGGATYLLAGCDLWQRGVYRTGALTNADLTANTQWFLYAPGSPSNIRIRASTFTSGSVTVAGRGTLMATAPFPFWAKTPTQASVTLTASTSETTLLAAGGSGVFLDLAYLKCSNTSSTASVISVRDATAGTVRDTIVCPAAIQSCEGNVYSVPWRQTSANANWTIQAGTSASSIICTAQAVPR